MRKLSDTLLALISTKMGLEPYNIIETPFGSFADRTIKDNDNNTIVLGKILELGNLDTALRFDGVGSTGTVTVKLDDTDGTLLQIYNSRNLHNDPVKIYQAFTALPEKFVIFEGFIATPITWNETDRTFSFSVISKVTDYEVGFAPEDGQFFNLKESFVGKAWPLCFGQPQFVPAMPLQIAPTCILLDPFGYPDPGIPLQISRLFAQNGSLAANSSVPALLFPDDPFGEHSLEETNARLAEIGDQVQQASEAIAQQGADIVRQASDLQRTYDDQKRYLPTKALRVTMEEFPEGQFTVKINDSFLKATFTRVDQTTGTMKVKDLPQEIYGPGSFTADKNGNITDYRYGATKEGFRYFSAGSQITIISEFKIPHVCNILPSEIVGVYAYRSFGGVKKLTKVPEQYYTISIGQPDFSVEVDTELNTINPNVNAFYKKLFGSTTGNVTGPQISGSGWFQPTFINLKRPLSLVSFFWNESLTRIEQIEEAALQIYDSSYLKGIGPDEHLFQFGTLGVPSHVLPSQEWEDDIYVVVNSPVGPNIVDVMRWIIQTFTVLGIDEDSFAKARDFLALYPVNFALFEKKDAYNLLQEMALQSRSAVYVKEDKFFIKYLAAEDDPIDTITENDIEVGSLELTTSTTEEIVTKYVATWRPNYSPEGVQNRVVIITNVLRYGLVVSDQDYYIYNSHYAVKKSATFWMIRRANTWKKLKFRCFLTKLSIETFDTVKIDFSLIKISNKPVNGIVESAVYDSSNNTIEMSVWLPILAGEMDQHNLAYLVGAQITDVFPTIHEIQSGGGTGNLINYNPIGFPNLTGGGAAESGGIIDTNSGNQDKLVNTLDRPESAGVTFPSDEADKPTGVQSDTNLPNTANAEPPPRYDYTLRDSPISVPSFGQTATGGGAGNTIPGIVVSGSGITYRVNIFPNGLKVKPQSVQVRQVQADPSVQIPAGAGCMVSNVKGQYYMQVNIGSGGAIPGVVAGGSGNDYNVVIYPNGLDKASQTVQVRQLQIDSSETIPGGTACIVSKVGGKYYMQVPVWL